ncbi:MAG: hypothetical protein OQJ97_17480 [Rhodospirillales bacterium]|nr:hypothetical protein [Rhodospirillales bacterium]
MNTVGEFQSAINVGLDDARKAAATAAHCPVAPEGACPAYTALRRLSDPNKPPTPQQSADAISRIRGCPSAQTTFCLALELIDDPE